MESWSRLQSYVSLMWLQYSMNMWRNHAHEISPCDTWNRDNSRCSHKIHMFHFWKALSSPPQLCQNQSLLTAVGRFHFTVFLSTPPLQPTTIHQQSLLAITSLVRKSKNLMGQMPCKTMWLLPKKEKGVLLPSFCSENSLQEDLNMVIVQESSYFSSLFFVTSTAVVHSLFSQISYDISDFWQGRLIKERFVKLVQTTLDSYLCEARSQANLTRQVSLSYWSPGQDLVYCFISPISWLVKASPMITAILFCLGMVCLCLFPFWYGRITQLKQLFVQVFLARGKCIE